MTEYNIKIGSDGNPDTSNLSCSPGDKISWTNNYSQTIETFALPTCVAPQTSPAPIAVGATTSDFTVNANAKGSYEYSYGWPDPKRATRGGTIDVGSK